MLLSYKHILPKYKYIILKVTWSPDRNYVQEGLTRKCDMKRNPKTI